MSIEWDGKGLPPVYCECEALTNGEWRKVMVCYIGEPAGETEALVFDLKSTRPFWGDEFRPILTEAERRREGRIKSLNAFIGGYMKSTSGDYSKLGEALFEWLAVLDKANDTGS